MPVRALVPGFPGILKGLCRPKGTLMGCVTSVCGVSEGRGGEVGSDARGGWKRKGESSGGWDNALTIALTNSLHGIAIPTPL